MAKWPETLRAAVEEHGRRPKGMSKGAYYGYLADAERGPSPSLRKVLAWARELGVRPEYLILGQEPMSADAFVVVKRSLELIDGIFAEWQQPDQKEARRMAREFRAAFGKSTTIEYRQLGPIVQLVFGDLFARVMHCYRSAGYVEVFDPAWRGERARHALRFYHRQAREVDTHADFNKEPWSTRAFLTVMVRDMKRWENAAPVPPGDAFAPD